MSTDLVHELSNLPGDDLLRIVNQSLTRQGNPKTAMFLNLISGPASVLLRSRASNPKLDLALAAVPRVDEINQMISDLVAGVSKIETDPQGTVREEVLNSLAAGNGVPNGLLTRHAEVMQNDAAFMGLKSLLEDLHRDLGAELSEAFADGLPQMCAALERDLRRVLAALRRRGHAAFDSAESAIEADAIETWQKDTGLRTEYSQIRAAHHRIIVSYIKIRTEDAPIVMNHWPILGHAGSLAVVWPDLPEYLSNGAKFSEDQRKVLLRPPWPDPSSESFIDWLIDNPTANAWVPTFNQAAELRHSLRSSAKFTTEQRYRPDEYAAEYANRLSKFAKPPTREKHG